MNISHIKKIKLLQSPVRNHSPILTERSRQSNLSDPSNKSKTAEVKEIKEIKNYNNTLNKTKNIQTSQFKNFNWLKPTHSVLTSSPNETKNSRLTTGYQNSSISDKNLNTIGIKGKKKYSPIQNKFSSINLNQQIYSARSSNKLGNLRDPANNFEIYYTQKLSDHRPKENILGRDMTSPKNLNNIHFSRPETSCTVDQSQETLITSTNNDRKKSRTNNIVMLNSKKINSLQKERKSHISKNIAKSQNVSYSKRYLILEKYKSEMPSKDENFLKTESSVCIFNTNSTNLQQITNDIESPKNKYKLIKNSTDDFLHTNLNSSNILEESIVNFNFLEQSIKSDLKSSIFADNQVSQICNILKQDQSFYFKRNDPILLKPSKINFDFKILLKIYSSKDRNQNLFKILQFLDNKDLKNLFNSSKRMRLLLKMIIFEKSKILVDNIKNKNRNFEVLKTKLSFSLIKGSLIIDLKIISRILNNPSKSTLSECISWGIHTKNIHSGTIYKNFYKLDINYSNIHSFSYWICREYSENFLDVLQKCYIQPILQFLPDDIITYNINIFSDKGFLDFNQTKIFFSVEQNKYITIAESIIPKNIYAYEPRICEMEILKNYWKDIGEFHLCKDVNDRMNSLFGKCFEIASISFDDVGYVIFKILLRAKCKGEIIDDDELGIKLKVRDKNEIIKNEVKKNNLIYEKRNVLELRINDEIIFYLSHTK